VSTVRTTSYFPCELAGSAERCMQVYQSWRMRAFDNFRKFPLHSIPGAKEVQAVRMDGIFGGFL
jgi:hypothetical protein